MGHPSLKSYVVLLIGFPMEMGGGVQSHNLWLTFQARVRMCPDGEGIHGRVLEFIERMDVNQDPQ